MATQEPLLDMVGPPQVFSVLQGFNDQYRPVVVAERIEPMPTDTPLTVIADKTFEEVPDPGRGARPRWRRFDHQGHGGSGDRQLPAPGRRDL